MKKKLIKLISGLLAVVFLVGMFAGCDLITTDNKKDMELVVAEVNITNDREALDTAFSLLGSDKTLNLTDDQLKSIAVTDEIYKRDLIAYFLSYGYNYVSQGSSYSEVFNMLMDALVERKITAQFATVYYLNAGEVVVDRASFDTTDAYYEAVQGSNGMKMKGEISVEGYLDAIEGKTGDEAAVAGYSYFLTQDEINYAEYVVKTSINDAIDSYEEEIISAQSDSDSSSEETRAIPTGANEKSDYYYPKKTGESGSVLDYDIYTATGNNKVSDCGEYEKVDGSTAVTRARAYVRFIDSLKKNYLISDGEDILSITDLAYYQMELKTQMEQLVIAKYAATLALDMSDRVTEATIQKAYQDEIDAQKVSSQTDFVTTMDSISDTTFIVYSPKGRTYGYVYNILLPFSSEQSNLALKELQNKFGTETKEYYAERNKLFQHIKATDQRSSWFNGSEDYSFDAAEKGVDYYNSGSNSSCLFFEDSLVKSEDGIDRYAGKYPYNGKVGEKDKDGKYKLTPNEISIDEFIAEMEGYINYVTGATASGQTGYASGTYAYGDVKNSKGEDTSDSINDFYQLSAADFWNSADNTIDYSKMIYYTGSVNGVKDVSAAEYLRHDTEETTAVSYKALSAVNELMFAYTTDTAALNTYFGYSIAAKEDSTSYVKEFEYAAQKALDDGAGAYYVVGTDYGWHILYVSFVFTGEEVYGSDGFNYDSRTIEGTFSYYFYKAKKETVVSNYQTDKQSDVNTTLLDGDKIVVKYEKRYSDLTSIGA